MKAITVRQPWAWAIVHGGKDVENRTRNIAGGYRGPVAIHAATHPNPGPWWAAVDPPFSSHPGDDLENWGAVIGVVDLVDVHNHEAPTRTSCRQIIPADCSPWAEGGVHHLVLRNPRPLAEPIPWRGQLGLWNLPDDALPDDLRAEVAS